MKFPSRPAHRAFTLIEVMIAMAILGVIVTAIYASWTAILRGTEAGQKAAADVQRTRIAMRTMEQALSSAVLFSANSYFYSFDTDTSGNFASLSFVSRLPDSFPGSGMFPGQPLRRVTFEVISGTDGMNQLVVRQMQAFEVLQPGEEPYAIVLSRNVSQFALEFWDPKVNDWTDEWTLTNQLPRQVRVYLGHTSRQNGAASTETIDTREIALASAAVTPDLQGGPPGTNAPNLNLGGLQSGLPGGVNLNIGGAGRKR